MPLILITDCILVLGICCCLWESLRLYFHFLQGTSTDFLLVSMQCALEGSNCLPLSLLSSREWHPTVCLTSTWPRGLRWRLSTSQPLPTVIWEFPSHKVRLLISNLKGSEKYAEVRKCPQSSGRFTTSFLNVGNFNDIGSYSILGEPEEGAVTDCGRDTGKSPLPRAELRFSAVVDRLQPCEVPGPRGRDAHLGGSCVVRAELPQPAQALLPSLQGCSHQLARSQGHCLPE